MRNVLPTLKPSWLLAGGRQLASTVTFHHATTHVRVIVTVRASERYVAQALMYSLWHQVKDPAMQTSIDFVLVPLEPEALGTVRSVQKGEWIFSSRCVQGYC